MALDEIDDNRIYDAFEAAEILEVRWYTVAELCRRGTIQAESYIGDSPWLPGGKLRLYRIPGSEIKRRIAERGKRVGQSRKSHAGESTESKRKPGRPRKVVPANVAPAPPKKRGRPRRKLFAENNEQQPGRQPVAESIALPIPPMSLAEVAEALHVHKAVIFRAIDQGELVPVQPTTRGYFFTPTAVGAFECRREAKKRDDSR